MITQDPSIIGPNTSRPMHLTNDPRNDQFSGFIGNDLGHQGIPPKSTILPMSPLPLPTDPTMII